MAPPPRIQIHHELVVALRDDLDILLHLKRVIELARRLRLAVRDVADLGVDAHLDARAAFGRDLRVAVARGHDRRVRVGHRCRQIQHGADGHGVLEGRGVERDERGPAVRDGRGAREC